MSVFPLLVVWRTCCCALYLWILQMDMFYFCNIFGYSFVRGDFHFWGQNVELLDYEYCAYVCHEDNSWGGT